MFLTAGEDVERYIHLRTRDETHVEEPVGNAVGVWVRFCLDVTSPTQTFHIISQCQSFTTFADSHIGLFRRNSLIQTRKYT